ncbi:hypothetical protein AK812_SmicGene739 [Symbiodinium microadriaticum]|uniref:Uncharacterized protein n=1 Tax=Symbiodinium microadriaticum TaxID=2951 RepID=A0A1Q9F5Y2_SYMMI|nr:hypothetical protein AK812_SmicGene739 [Symbiodinium microadriaticum]
MPTGLSLARVDDQGTDRGRGAVRPKTVSARRAAEELLESVRRRALEDGICLSAFGSREGKLASISCSAYSLHSRSLETNPCLGFQFPSVSIMDSSNPVSLDWAASVNLPMDVEAVAATQLDPTTQLDPATPPEEALTATLREEALAVTPVKKRRQSYEALLSPVKTSPTASASSTFAMVKEDPYLASPSPSVKSPMDLADEELEKVLQKHFGRRPEPLSRVLEQAADPAALPASLEDVRIGKKVTEFPVEVQKRLVSLYLVGLQCGIHRPEEQPHLVLLTSDGFWHPVLERLLQGIMEKYHSDKRKANGNQQLLEEMPVEQLKSRTRLAESNIGVVHVLRFSKYLKLGASHLELHCKRRDQGLSARLQFYKRKACPWSLSAAQALLLEAFLHHYMRRWYPQMVISESDTKQLYSLDAQDVLLQQLHWRAQRSARQLKVWKQWLDQQTSVVGSTDTALPEENSSLAVVCGSGMDERTLAMVQGLFAMIFGAAVLSLLSEAQVFPRRCVCQTGPGIYGFCEVWQDCRTVISFMMGALICHCTRCSKGDDDQEPTGRKGLHLSMIW